MFQRRHTTSQRFLALVVGGLFLASAAVAHAKPCCCTRSHEDSVCHAQSETAPPAGNAGGQPCCPVERQEDAPEPRTTPSSGHDDGLCPCHDVAGDASDDPLVLRLGVLRYSEQDEAEQAGTASPVSEAAGLSLALQDAPRWRPTRGSPLPHPPLHLLNSVFII